MKPTITWYFLGSDSNLDGVVSLTEFGQRIALPAHIRPRDALKVCCIPEQEFAAAGFTAEELDQYKYPASHDGAPAAFLAKKRQALIALHELRTKGEVNG